MPTPNDGEPAVAAQASGALERGELFARIASSVVLAPAALATAWAGGPIFAGFIAAGGVILAREWTRMSDPHGSDLAFALAAGGASAATIAASAQLDLLAVGLGAAMALAAGLEAARRGRAFDAAFGVAYIAAACAALVSLRLEGPREGALIVTFLYASVWGADIGAYAAGKMVGGPRLLAKVSPNKTWAGLAGGLALAVCFGVGASALTGWRAPAAGVAGAAAALGLAGLGGDLFESSLKRRYGVKDSGALIPGHGGLFDRVDGLMAASLALAGWMWAEALA